EAAEYKPVLGQAELAACGNATRYLAFGIVRLIAVREMKDFFPIECLLAERQHNPVGNDIVDKVRAHRARIAKIIHLDRRRACRQDGGPRALGVALEIDRDVDAEIKQEVCDLGVALGDDIEKTVEG